MCGGLVAPGASIRGTSLEASARARSLGVGVAGVAAFLPEAAGSGNGRGVPPLDAHAPVKTAQHNARLNRVFVACDLVIDAIRIGAASRGGQMLLTTNLREVYSRGSLTPQQSSGKISSELRGAYTNRPWNRRFF